MLYISGTLAILSGLFDERFRTEVYNRLGELLDLLALINSCACFLIYCGMSELFRQEFRAVFLPQCIEVSRIWVFECGNSNKQEF